MPDSPDQIICRLEQENRSLKKILNQKDKELNLERNLWKSRDGALNRDAYRGAMMHRIEVFDDIIRSKAKLRHATLADREKFQYMLERAESFLTHSDRMPLFRDNAGRESDPGNRCNLYLRHALLMALVHKKDNPPGGCLPQSLG